jgi:hypothetical protein
VHENWANYSNESKLLFCIRHEPELKYTASSESDRDHVGELKYTDSNEWIALERLAG